MHWTNHFTTLDTLALNCLNVMLLSPCNHLHLLVFCSLRRLILLHLTTSCQNPVVSTCHAIMWTADAVLFDNLVHSMNNLKVNLYSFLQYFKSLIAIKSASKQLWKSLDVSHADMSHCWWEIFLALIAVIVTFLQEVYIFPVKIFQFRS